MKSPEHLDQVFQFTYLAQHKCAYTRHLITTHQFLTDQQPTALFFIQLLQIGNATGHVGFIWSQLRYLKSQNENLV